MLLNERHWHSLFIFLGKLVNKDAYFKAYNCPSFVAIFTHMQKYQKEDIKEMV